MDTVKRYKNVLSARIDDLDDLVNKAMEEGWMPTGNIAELVNGKVYAQSMILYPTYPARRSEGAITWATLAASPMLRTEDVGADNGND